MKPMDGAVLIHGNT